MLNKVYRLISAKQFEPVMIEEEITENTTIVRPTSLSICHADQRYYTGNRDKEVLKKKLPMALIHEGVGVVVKDCSETFNAGDRVVIVPNTPIESSAVVDENYLLTSKFRSSGFDGLMQEYIFSTPDRLVKVPDCISDNVAAYSELVSVAIHSIDRLERIRNSDLESFGVWGDGSLGYITANILYDRYPNSKIYVFGKDEEKLSLFSFVETFVIDEIPSDLKISHCFECVGGRASGNAINQIIEYIKPQGTIGIMGVSEDEIPVNTRMILERGLTISGTSRSSALDFKKSMAYLSEFKNSRKRLENLMSKKVHVRKIDDIHQAFEADIYSGFGKTVISWDI